MSQERPQLIIIPGVNPPMSEKISKYISGESLGFMPGYENQKRKGNPCVIFLVLMEDAVVKSFHMRPDRITGVTCFTCELFPHTVLEVRNIRARTGRKLDDYNVVIENGKPVLKRLGNMAAKAEIIRFDTENNDTHRPFEYIR